MLRSHFEFAACVLYIIFISSVLSATFGDFCSNDLSCLHSLICSNASRCICPISSFWNVKRNSCLSCPQGWNEWQNEKCLLFIAPADGGIIHQNARNACLTQSAELLQVKNHQDFIQFQYKIDELLKNKPSNTAIELLSNGIWIDSIPSTKPTNSYDWCDMKYGDDLSPWNDCISIKKQSLKNMSDTSVCLNHVQCNEKLSYICEKSAQIQDHQNNAKDHDRIFDIMANLVGNLLFPPPPATQQSQTPLIIYHTNPPQQILPQKPKSNNMILYIGIAVGIIVLVIILLCCCFGGGFLLWQSNTTFKEPIRPSRSQQRHNRTSIDSTASDATS